jgi:hypothetical protein
MSGSDKSYQADICPKIPECFENIIVIILRMCRDSFGAPWELLRKNLTHGVDWIILDTMGFESSKVFTKQLKNDDVLRWFAFSIIALAVLVSYYPTLYYPPRSDQVIYLAEIANKHHPWDLIFGCYDLNRHRIYTSGDEILFRPLLFMLLGSEQGLFGHNFLFWQGLGILAHLGLVWVLLRLLWHLSGPWLGFAGTWVFALSVVNYELVSWPHLTSYILMMIFVILAIEQVIFCFEEKELAWDRIRRITVFLSGACFIYETANLFTIWIMVLLIIFFPKKRLRALTLAVPVMLYGLFSFYNYVYVNHVSRALSSHGASIGKYLYSIIYVIIWWLYEGLFNSMYGYVMHIRTMFQSNEVLVFKPLGFDDPQVILELIILFAFGGLVWINRREFVNKIKLLIILAGMLLAYVAIIVVGRYEEGSIREAVRVNTYYLYLFWVMMVVMAFLLIVTKKYSGRGRWFVAIFVTASLVLGVFQGIRIYSIASGYEQATNNTVILARTLDLLIQEKGREPDFSFYVDPDYPGNYTYIDKGANKKTDPPDKRYSFVELLYPQYSHPKESAKYKMLIKNP